MEFVCNDLDGKTPWHFDVGEKIYYRDFKDGRHKGKIAGKDIPDPNKLTAARTDFLKKAAAGGAKVMSSDWEKAKASATTFKLFEHWQEVSKHA
jgi:hypothetical protein